MVVTLGPALPAAAQGGDPPVAESDGGGEARWVAGEIALLAAGSIAGRVWVSRRARRGKAARPTHDPPGAGAGLASYATPPARAIRL